MIYSNQYKCKTREHFGNKYNMFNSDRILLNHNILKCNVAELIVSFSFEGIDWGGPCGKSLGPTTSEETKFSVSSFLSVCSTWLSSSSPGLTHHRTYMILQPWLSCGNHSSCPQGTQNVVVYFSLVPTGTQHHAWKKWLNNYINITILTNQLADPKERALLSLIL